MRIRLALLAGAVLLAVGCDAQAGTGAPQETSPPPPALWDPCTLSDSTVQAVGMDTDTKETGIGGAEQPGVEICSWRGSEYGITVYSTDKGMDEIHNKPGNSDFRPVTIAGRNGEEHRVEGATKELGCYIAFPAEQGVVEIALLGWPGDDALEDPCGGLGKAAEALVPELPA